jgi:hypothetical protein
MPDRAKPSQTCCIVHGQTLLLAAEILKKGGHQYSIDSADVHTGTYNAYPERHSVRLTLSRLGARQRFHDCVEPPLYPQYPLRVLKVLGR